MRLLWTILLVVGIAQRSQGQQVCYTCDVWGTDYNGYPTEGCFHPITSGTGAIGTQTCGGGGAAAVEYCETKFIIQDGVVTEAHRGCALSTSDDDLNTNGVPSSDKCHTSVNEFGNPNDYTTCYYPCTGDKCNIKSAEQVKQCTSDCNSGLGRGSCDYISGNCVCNNGWTSANCGTADTSTIAYTPRKCVQCNSETDTGCVTSTASQSCPSSERSCSTATTRIYDLSDVVRKTVTTRGCTNDYKAVDECSFTNIFTDSTISNQGYNEFTCYSMCDSDGCNTNSANGQLNAEQGEAIPLFCVQCSDPNGNGWCNTGTGRSRCPSGSTHCKSTVTYLISDAVDVSYRGAEPAYKLRSVVRECATEAVPTQCTDEKFSTIDEVTKVTCTESCQTDGCNTGWPARPKCISCSTGTDGSGSGNEYDGCLENPPQPEDCSRPYDKYCFIVDLGIEKDKRARIQGYPRRIYRGCSHYDIGTQCTEATPRSTDIQNCNRTCSTDGCNVGSGSLMPLQNLVAVFVPLLLGRLLQYTN